MSQPNSPSTGSTSTAGHSNKKNWRGLVLDELERRNSLERDSFRDIFSAYHELLEKEKSARTRQLELELQIKQGGAIISNGGEGGGSENEKLLQDKVRALQDELISALRLEKENEEVRKLLLKKDQELDDVKTQLESAKEEKVLDDQELSHLKDTQILLQDQIRNLRAQLEESEKKVILITKENVDYVERIKNDKQKFIEQMNRMNELLNQALLKTTNIVIPDMKLDMDEISNSDNGSNFNSGIYDVGKWPQFSAVPKDVMRTIKAHRGEVSSIAFDQNGLCLVSGGSDSVVKNWKVGSGVELGDFRGAKQAIMSVRFSPDGSLVITAGNDRIARIYKRKTYRILQTLTGHTNKIYSCNFDVESTRAVTGSFDRTIRIWDVSTGTPKKTIMCYSSCNHTALSPDDLAIASAHLDGHIRIWSLKTGEEIIDMNKIHKQQVTGVHFSSDGHLLCSASRDNTILIIDMRMYKKLRTIKHPDYENRVNWSRPSFSPDGQHICAGSSKGSIFIWNVDEGTCKKELKGHKGAITFVDWSQQGAIASCDKSGQIKVWS